MSYIAIRVLTDEGTHFFDDEQLAAAEAALAVLTHRASRDAGRTFVDPERDLDSVDVAICKAAARRLRSAS